MALTAAQQRRFHAVGIRWLTDQIAAGNDRALYQLWKASAAQIKANITPYLNADKAGVVANQAAAPAAYAAQDAILAGIVTEIDAVLVDPNP
jgi:hypothetical protein